MPRTPQQIQHLQRLQIQRQQIGATAGAGAAGGTVPGDSSDPQMSPGQQQVVVGKQQVVVSGGGGMVQPSSEMPGTPQQVNAGVFTLSTMILHSFMWQCFCYRLHIIEITFCALL